MATSHSWVELRAEDIESALNDGELNEYRQHAAQLPDPLPSIVADVTALVRGYLSTRYQIATPGIPAALKAATLDLVIYRLCKRVHRAGDEDEQRKRAADDAVRLLEAASRGEFGDFSSAEDPKGGSWGSATKLVV